ncbi:hypothetical protein GC722_06930 [Auraticoccus sp. F435]|uniref:Endonuclease/exonuclease/phosphatase domain-containing protein n=1 Tax=Auraticoccus cholistanensis TaxID=2656650 RepID=A0A6A9V0K3_9ACTN|nr:endonuclease/exonuclease/phosphatase family protein [Auraticoccus cholistanensis]MVA75759.1 hypothetical protein [Auraticoccus cholistanensis]
MPSPVRRRLLRAGTAVLASLALTLSVPFATPAAEAAPAAPAAPAGTVASDPLVVSSYNIKCANCFDGKPNEKPWLERRFKVVDVIRYEDPDILGVQEASQGWLKSASGQQVDKSQFEDLVQRLGRPYKLTNSKRNNCVRHTTPTSCTYKYQGASQGTKLIYNSDRVTYYGTGGSRKLTSKSGANARYAVWAVFTQESTGKKVFVVNTHLEPRDASSSRTNWELRRKQAQDVVALIRDKRPAGMPMLLLGDFNSHKWTQYGNAPYAVFKDYGLVDPLGNADKTTTRTVGATVEKRVQTNVSSYNNFERKAPAFDYVNGTYLDYVMTSKMRVSRWKTVANLDSSGRFKGTIPSDHNMVRATVWLP